MILQYFPSSKNDYKQKAPLPFFLNLTAVGNIDTSGIGMLEEVKKVMDRKGVKVHCSSSF